MALLNIENLKKIIVNGSEKLEILRNVNLSLNAKEYISIKGRSGSGKSTLLSLISSLDQPTSGEIIINGEKMSDYKGDRLTEFRNRNIGIVFQSFNLLPNLNALENVELPLYFHSRKTKIRKKAMELLEMMGMGNKIKLYPNQLSGGEQQRVAIARSLSTSPKLLLADEPTGSLDLHNSKLVTDAFSNFVKTHDMAVIVVTHDDDVAKETKRIFYLDNGTLSERVD